MPPQQALSTFEDVHKILRQIARESRKAKRMSQETDRKLQEVAEQLKETQREIGKLGGRIGDIVVSMVKGNIVEKFQALGYDIDDCLPRQTFKNKKLGIKGEIDLLLDSEEGSTAILVEVKTTLETADVREHIERLEKYRRYVDALANNNKQRIIGAVAGAVVTDTAQRFAMENGLHVIVQSGDAVEIVESPEGFEAKKW